MNIDESKLECRCLNGLEVTDTEVELARHLDVSPEVIHKIMDEWEEAYLRVHDKKTA